jgi:hypothetical protein
MVWFARPVQFNAALVRSSFHAWVLFLPFTTDVSLLVQELAASRVSTGCG